MDWQMGFVFLLIAIAAVAFASNRFRYDMVALAVLLALALAGILSPAEAVAGFGNAVVILIAALMVLGEALNRTGVTAMIGARMASAGGESETRLIALVMLAGGGLGAFMSSTAIVAIFIPVLISVAAKTGVGVQRLLLPLAFGALISGMLTLIATPPNLILSEALIKAEYEGFGFFDFFPIGAIVLIGAIVYMLVLGRHLLPAGEQKTNASPLRRLEDLIASYDQQDQFHLRQIPAGSALVGRTLGETALWSASGVQVVLIDRQARWGPAIRAVPGAATLLRSGDLVLLHGSVGAVTGLAPQTDLVDAPLEPARVALWQNEAGVADLLLAPDSRLIGQTLDELDLPARMGLLPLGLKRAGELEENAGETRLRAGDTILAAGPWDKIRAQQGQVHDFVVLHVPAEMQEAAPARDRAVLAVGLLAAVVLLSAFEVMPIVIAALLAVLLAVGTRCLNMDDGYRAISWKSIVLVAAMLPVADAMRKTGGVDLLVSALMGATAGAGPLVLMSGFFFLSAGFSLVLSNTATAVIIAPVAIGAAEALGVAPHAFAMAVAIGASAGFATPISSPVVTLVVAPGGYQFKDFVLIGTPLILWTWAVTMLVVPLLFPLTPS